VAEFFELFKTDCELFRHNRRYEIVLSDGSVPLGDIDAPFIVTYAARVLAREADSVETLTKTGHCNNLRYGDLELPIYGGVVVFPSDERTFLADAQSGKPVSYFEQRDGRRLLRVGYDLFSEVRFLLTKGQPAVLASKPALEIHIALLRELLLMHGAPLIEVPPVPEGYKFIACLTHDVDHPSLRSHKCDHTAVGFLYRAIFGSLVNLITSRGTLRQLLRNWWAAAKLPLVYLGIAKDFWLDFTRYLKLDAGHPSTFYFIPFKGERGRLDNGLAPRRRAADYDVRDLRVQLQELAAAKCELALHGIDAWRDVARARAESERIRQMTGHGNGGIRMHWLYFDEESPATLDSAGFNYDSTVGFNDTVGFRAGTTQVYKPLNSSGLLELPLHVMDTALFYPTYLNLRPNEAMDQVRAIIADAVRFGGCITINWHDRSISPERCWDGFYKDLVRELEVNGAWFATAEGAVSWFRKRRAVKFATDASVPENVFASLKSDSSPPLQWHFHNVADAGTQAAYVS
jgi:hypothetical protein